MTEYLNLIYKIVWSYVKSNPGLDFDDLVSEACLAYLEERHMYSQERGKESTFIWKVVQNRLNAIIGQEKTRYGAEILLGAEIMEGTLIDSSADPELILITEESWQEKLASLSPEAQSICALLTQEQEIYLPAKTPRNCRGVISKVLKAKGWREAVVWRTFNELKSAFS